MRFLTPLLLAALGAVVVAAPAAPLSLPAPKKEKDEKSEDRGRPATGRVVLRSAGQQEHAPNLESDTPDATTEQAPFLRSLRLPAPARYSPPTPSRRDDVRAGLLALPPPTA